MLPVLLLLRLPLLLMPIPVLLLVLLLLLLVLLPVPRPVLLLQVEGRGEESFLLLLRLLPLYGRRRPADTASQLQWPCTSRRSRRDMQTKKRPRGGWGHIRAPPLLGLAGTPARKFGRGSTAMDVFKLHGTSEGLSGPVQHYGHRSAALVKRVRASVSANIHAYMHTYMYAPPPPPCLTATATCFATAAPTASAARTTDTSATANATASATNTLRPLSQNMVLELCLETPV